MPSHVCLGGGGEDGEYSEGSGAGAGADAWAWSWLSSLRLSSSSCVILAASRWSRERKEAACTVDPGTSKRRFRVVASREPPPVACSTSEVELPFVVAVLVGLLPLVVVDEDIARGCVARPRSSSSQSVTKQDDVMMELWCCWFPVGVEGGKSGCVRMVAL